MLYKNHIKRLLDFLFSAVLLLILWPLLLLLAFLICLDSHGPVIFKQERAGLHRKSFFIYKFRTMYSDAPDNVAAANMARRDSYVTRIGGFLRKTGVDELPQLLNILKGDMSFVGPRPLILKETEIIEARDALGVYELRPGLTGWAQINGRDTVKGQAKAALDAVYAEKVSFGFDLMCCIKTISVVLRSDGFCEKTGN